MLTSPTLRARNLGTIAWSLTVRMMCSTSDMPSTEIMASLWQGPAAVVGDVLDGASLDGLRRALLPGVDVEVRVADGDGADRDVVGRHAELLAHRVDRRRRDAEVQRAEA